MVDGKTTSVRDAERAIWMWLDAFSACVRARDFAEARKLFARETIGFGTITKTARTRAQLERDQWGRVWPKTSGFRFERAGARLVVSADHTQAVVAVTWKACNQAAPKKLVFDRRGRATVVLTRAEAAAPWRAEHTHFSFNPPAAGVMASGS